MKHADCVIKGRPYPVKYLWDDYGCRWACIEVHGDRLLICAEDGEMKSVPLSATSDWSAENPR